MATYSYTAKDMNGKTIKGTFEAATQDEVVGLIREKRYIPVEIKEERQKSKLSTDVTFFEKKVKLRDLALFCRQFATTLRSGITVVDSLDILKKQSTNKKLQRVVEALHEDVQKGNSLSSAFAKEPKIFPSILVNMIETGEVSGNLDEVMDKMAYHFEKEYRINQKVKSAITYPIVVSIVAVSVVILLLTFVVPTFVTMFASFDAELPGPTKALIAISDSIKNFWYVYILVIGAAILLYRRYVSTKQGRLKVDEIKLKIPAFGELNNKIAMNRFASNMEVMLTAGVDIIQAVDIVEKVVGNEYIRESLWDVKDGIRKGFGLGASMENNGAFPPLVYQMVEVGETSGTLDYVLGKVSDFYETEVDTAISQLTTILEPIIIVVLGIIVAFIIISMLLPMFDLYSIIS
ncbi:type II secretion system F family protein [Alkalibacter rhizosphaerae]|uniref:Type II secretion system F family protein n=1 Tax=Alkalibacter rhizosphaerae TaxID=2815577 RepID=A0A974XH65_9FIRM|nr:type II secretion system F family protein [Alkalibacter rhizosphaerae]QSX08655.1 type II secretion system F family protein [Alkalibacter rhizosphaerae]